MRTIVLILALIGVACPALADWPQFRGPGGSGVSSDKGLPTTWSADTNVVWKTPLPGAGTSSPVTLGENIFLTAYSGYGVPRQPGGDMTKLKRHVLCLDRATGTVRWDRDVPSKLPERPAERIREGHGYASSTPAVDAERVYAFFGKSGVVALDHKGKPLWQAGVGDRVHEWGSAASPVLWKDLVIVNASVESDALVALNKKTGKEAWRTPGIKESWNTPLLVDLPGGRTDLVVAIQGKVLGFDPATGKERWSCRTDIGWYMVPSLVADGGVIFCIGGRSGGSLAVRAGGKGEVTATHRLWTGRKGSNVSSPVYHQGHLYFANDNTGVAYCVEAKSGKTVYEERLERAAGVYASPVLADGKLYYFSRDGTGFVLAAAPEFRVLGRNPLPRGEGVNSTPIVDRGRLLVRTDRFLYCFDSK